MWFEFFDFVFFCLWDVLFFFSFMVRIKGVSGLGQQYGSVWWSDKVESLLVGLDVGKEGGLKVQLEGVLIYDMVLNWQDQSMQKECDVFDVELGDWEKFVEVIGSGVYYVSCFNLSLLF